MAQVHILGNKTPYALYRITRGGTDLTTRVASGGGTISHPGTTGATFAGSRYTNFLQPSIGGRQSAMMAPSAGESFLAPADLRLVATGYDGTGGGTGGDDSRVANSVAFYLNDTLVATVTSASADYWVFSTRVTGIAAGTYAVWCRSHYGGGTFLDSLPHTITVSAPPTYAQTITLTGNTAWDSATLGSGTLDGSSGAKIKVDCAGFVINGSGSGALLWDHVDVYHAGGTSGTTATLGIDITTSGNTSVTNCRFIACAGVEVTNTGTSTVAWTGNLSPSNSRNRLGQLPDSDSDPCWTLNGNASGAKTFQGNNVAAGRVVISSASWTLGGTTDAHENVLIGPRVGLDFTNSSFSGTVKRNVSVQLYYGGWSQANMLEAWGVTPTIEHNIFAGGSWPVRGVVTEFRYNLVLGLGPATEGLIWLHSAAAANVHHNVLRAPGPTRGVIYNVYGGTHTIRNNTLDGVDQTGGHNLMELESGTHTVNSCLLVNGDSTPIDLTGSTALTADYNGFHNNDTGDLYSDARTPTNDVSANPTFNAAPTLDLPFDLAAVWGRTKTVASILSDYRGYYRPTNSAMDAGDTGTYGANNPIGAIARSGVSNANDLFGTL